MANKNALSNLINKASKAAESEHFEDFEGATAPSNVISENIVDLDATIDLDDIDSSKDNKEPLEITEKDLEKALRASQENTTLDFNEVEDNSEIEALKEKISYYENLEQELVENHKLEIEELNQKHQEEISRLNQEKENVQDNSNEIKELKEAHQKELTQLKEDHSYEMNSKEEEFDQKIYKLEEKHSKELEELQNKLELQKLELNDQEDYKSKIESLEGELKEIKEQKTDSENKEIKSLKKQIEKLEKDQKEFDKKDEVFDEEKKELQSQFKIKIEDLTSSYEDKLKDLKSKHEKEIQDLIESNDSKVKEILDKYENNGEIVITNLHQFVLNYVCRDLVTEIADDYESGIYTKEYAKDLFDKFLNGEINSQDFFLLALIKEMKEKNKISKFLGDDSDRILDYFIEEEVTLL